MDPQNNSTPINLGKRKMVLIWTALIGGFVIIIILVAVLLYQSRKENSLNQPTIIKKSVEQKTKITPADENINKEVENINVGDLETDFKTVEKDINQL